MKAVIFDMDGVLINTEPLHYRCWKEILKEKNGIDLDYEVYLPCIGSTRGFFMDLINENYGPVFDDVDKMNALMKEKKAQITEAEGFPEMPGIKEALKQLKDEGYLLAVASSYPAYAIKDALKSLDMEKYFTVVMSGDYVEHPKPAPDTFLVTAEKLGMEPEDCLVVEDSTNGGGAALLSGLAPYFLSLPVSTICFFTESRTTSIISSCSFALCTTSLHISPTIFFILSSFSGWNTMISSIRFRNSGRNNCFTSSITFAFIRL